MDETELLMKDTIGLYIEELVKGGQPNPKPTTKAKMMVV